MKFAFMDSHVFKNKDIEEERLTLDREPELPPTNWYQPTREDALGYAVHKTPQFMLAQDGGPPCGRSQAFSFSRRGVIEIDERVVDEGIAPEAIGTPTRMLDDLQDGEPVRPSLVETIFHLLCLNPRSRTGS